MCYEEKVNDILDILHLNRDKVDFYIKKELSEYIKKSDNESYQEAYDEGYEDDKSIAEFNED